MPLHYEEKHAKSILTPTGGFLNSYTHSLNPYEGCLFGKDTSRGKGCPFCYVRELPLAKFAPHPWGNWLRAKINAPTLLMKEIARFVQKHPQQKLKIFMSSSTDPYQSIEARLKLSQEILKIFSQHLADLALLVVQTRSPLVERDLTLFQTFGNKIWLCLTLETDDEAIRQRFTPTTASVSRRLATLAKFYQAGIPTQVTISPLLPCNPTRFAQLVDNCCHRVLIDTFLAGDGSGGQRSKRLGILRDLAENGYGEWILPNSHQPVLTAMQTILGNERVFFSQEGFSFN